jgi:hypothetical protein
VRGYIGGGALLFLSAFMLLGFLNAGSMAAVPAAIAFVVVVVLPAVGGVTLIARERGKTGSLATRRDQLRRQTIESELLRLAGAHGGRLTVVEVVSALALSPDDAKAALDSLTMQEIADLAVTDSGTIVYTFRDIERAIEKRSARNVLE